MYFVLKRQTQAYQTTEKRPRAGCRRLVIHFALLNVLHNNNNSNVRLPTICNKIWQTGEWTTPWTKSLVITLPKKGNLQQCQNDRTISLVSHPSKIMLKIILDRFKPQAEKIIAEEQAGEEDKADRGRGGETTSGNGQAWS